MKASPLYLSFTNREDWRNWLRENHAAHKEVWLVFYKNKTGKSSVAYEDTVEEALCFGWIDSLIKKIDEEKYARKYTPRTNTLKWSPSNIKRIKKLIAEGRMEEIGYSKLDKSIYDPVKNLLTENIPEQRPKELIVPDFMITFFDSHPPALQNFNALAPSHKRNYVFWINSAKTEPTIQKRLKEAVDLLKENKKLGMK
jgi:uncharacterized protein YdeI (YjbR/CyaY-like superfamily)